MITENELRAIAYRAAQATHDVTISERTLIIENAIREAVMQDRAVKLEPNAGCL